MFSQLEVYPTIPASDLNRARQFYADKLGLTPSQEVEGVGLLYQVGGGTYFLLYETPAAGTAQNTAMSFRSTTLEQDMADLRARGVVFEDYDLPGLKTVNGIAELGSGRGGWFKDSEGNILAIGEFSEM